MHYIERIVEPKSLLLSWQAAETIDPGRRRKVVGILEKGDDNLISFRYILDKDLEEAKQFGFQWYGIFDDFKKIYKEGVMDEFSRRLPLKKRKDYKNFLKALRIKPDQEISDFSLLGYSGALLPSDSFSLVNRFEHVDGNCQLLLEVAGFRYHMNTEIGNIFMEIALGDLVTFRPEPTNLYDPNAVAIYLHNRKIGYINKIVAPTIARWLKTRDINALIEKVTGTVERPRIFLFVSVS